VRARAPPSRAPAHAPRRTANLALLDLRLDDGLALFALAARLGGLDLVALERFEPVRLHRRGRLELRRALSRRLHLLLLELLAALARNVRHLELGLRAGKGGGAV
jgi:hypothetical protein